MGDFLAWPTNCISFFLPVSINFLLAVKRVSETGENRPHLIIHRIIGNQSGIPIGLSAIKAVFHRVIGNQSCIRITLCSMDIFKNEEISEVCENRIIVSSVASVKLAYLRSRLKTT